MDEQRLAACAEKLKRLNEKHRPVVENTPEPAGEETGAARDKTPPMAVPPPALSAAPSIPQSPPSTTQAPPPDKETLERERVERDRERLERERVERERVERDPERERVERDRDEREREMREREAAEAPAEEEVHFVARQPSPPVQRSVVEAPDPPGGADGPLSELAPPVEKGHPDRTPMPIRDYFNIDDSRGEPSGTYVCVIWGRSGKDCLTNGILHATMLDLRLNKHLWPDRSGYNFVSISHNVVLINVQRVNLHLHY